MIVTDADAIYTKAKSAAAEILLDIQDEDYGGRGFTCRDLEGHVWNFGSLRSVVTLSKERTATGKPVSGARVEGGKHQ